MQLYNYYYDIVAGKVLLIDYFVKYLEQQGNVNFNVVADEEIFVIIVEAWNNMLEGEQ